MTTATNPDEWADQIARDLPPLTAAEASAVGRIASALDERRGEQPAAPQRIERQDEAA